jgi:ribonuclease HI
MSTVTIHTDGGSRGNPGPAATGVVCYLDGKQIARFGEYLGLGTNNEAEYQAFQQSLRWLTKWGTEIDGLSRHTVVWHLDSKLVVEQLNRRWKIKEPRMAVFAKEIWQELAALPVRFSIQYVPRAENAMADEVVNEILNSQAVV